MTDLVRSAVELYIETDGGRELVGTGSGGGVDAGSVETELSGVQSRLEDLETTVDALRREIKSDENAVDPGLQRAVFESIPTEDELVDGERGLPSGEIAK